MKGAEETAAVNTHLRARAHDKMLIDQAAALTGANRSQFMLGAAIKEAKLVPLYQVSFLVDSATFQQILDTLEAPASIAERRHGKMAASRGQFDAPATLTSAHFLDEFAGTQASRCSMRHRLGGVQTAEVDASGTADRYHHPYRRLRRFGQSSAGDEFPANLTLARSVHVDDDIGVGSFAGDRNVPEDLVDGATLDALVVLVAFNGAILSLVGFCCAALSADEPLGLICACGFAACFALWYPRID